MLCTYFFSILQHYYKHTDIFIHAVALTLSLTNFILFYLFRARESKKNVRDKKCTYLQIRALETKWNFFF